MIFPIKLWVTAGELPRPGERVIVWQRDGRHYMGAAYDERRHRWVRDDDTPLVVKTPVVAWARVEEVHDQAVRSAFGGGYDQSDPA